MPNLVEVNYGRTGKSTNTDALGMREMQARDAQYLLVKAPPAYRSVSRNRRSD